MLILHHLEESEEHHSQQDRQNRPKIEHVYLGRPIEF